MKGADVDARKGRSIAEKIAAHVKKQVSAEAGVLGPVASRIARRNDRYRYQCMIKYKREAHLTTALRTIIEHYQREMARGDVTITVDLNPYMMM